MKLTIVYDNYASHPGLETAWGFGCLIEGFEQPILFDTGGDAAIFQRNLEALKIAPDKIGALVLSHAHWDHQNGMPALLEQYADLPVYLLKIFPDDLKQQVTDSGARLVEVQDATAIFENVFSTGTLGDAIPEQALILRTARGLIIITGCAHPGIVAIVKQAQTMFPGEETLLAMGGVHLYKTESAGISDVVAALRDLNVRNVAPTHCSGDDARRIFRDVYGDHAIEVGAGTVLTLDAIP